MPEPQESTAASTGENRDLDRGDVALPNDLHERLMEPPDTQSITDLRNALDKLETQDAANERLVTHLRALNKHYDVNAIRVLLETVTRE